MYSLLFPFIICVLALLLLVLLFKRKWLLSIIVLCLIVLVNIYSECYAVSFPLSCNRKDIRVLSYNVNSNSDYYINNDDSLVGFLGFIDSVDADIVLLQEYDAKWNSIINEELNNRYPFNSDSLLKDWGQYKSIYSRIPLRKVVPAPREVAPHVVFVEAFVKDKWVQLVDCHLASNHYTVNLNKDKASVFEYYSSLKEGYEKRYAQVNLIRDSLTAKSNMPKLLVGDLNDVSGSYVLQTLESCGLSDAWWTGGCGFGWTYDAHHLKLRLDHILYSDEFELKSVSVPHVKFSDHYPVVADFVIR